MKKSTIGAGVLAIVGVLFIGIMLLANTLLRGAQIDLTENNIYTLSEGTKNIVANLEEPVNLYLFFSERTVTPNPQIRNYGIRVRELLEDLVARSNGKLALKVIDPQPFTEEEDRATELGISPMRVGGENIYLGLAATNSTDGKHSIPFLDSQLEQQLEYDVAKLIHGLSTSKRPVIGWLSSLPMRGDFDMRTGRPRPPWVVYQQVEQLYTVRDLDVSVSKIDSDVDVLVLVHPKDLPPAALYAIDQYVLRGGRVLAFVDPNSQADAMGADPSDPMSAMSANKSSSLEPLLSAWGVTFDPDQVVVDLERGLRVAMREGEPPAQHIAILGLDDTAMANDVITGTLTSVNLATAGSLKAKEGGKLRFEPLIRTSAQAGVLPGQRFAMLTDPATLRDGFKPSGEQVVAARISGSASSAYPDGPPEGATAASDALKESSQPINVVVIADSDLLSDFMWVQTGNFLGQMISRSFADNGKLVWNALDNLAGSSDLISIRGRASYSRPFEKFEELRRTAAAQFRSTELELEEQLRQTEENLNKLQGAQPGDELLSPDQAREIERFQEQKLRIRKELRAVTSGLDRDIERLGARVKFINIIVVPGVFALIAVAMALWRKRRRSAIAMLRKGAAS